MLGLYEVFYAGYLFLRLITAAIVIYCVLIGVIFLVVCLDRFNLETAISATVSCFNNIGPAFNAAGPAKNYAGFSDLSKLTLSAAMLLGRLEIFPLLLAVFPVTWIKK